MRSEKIAAFVLVGGLTPIAKRSQFLAILKRMELSVIIIDEYDRVSGMASDEDFEQPVVAAVSSELENVCHVLNGLKSRYVFKGIYCISESLVTLSGYVAQLFDLPFPGFRASNVCSNKSLQRSFLSEYGPAVTLIMPDERERVCDGIVNFPRIIKPVKRHSSSGVMKVSDVDDLRHKISTFPDDEVLLLEEYVLGREVSVESLVFRGELLFSSVTQKTTTEQISDYFVEMGHTVPALNVSTEEVEMIAETNSRVLAALQFENGIAHAEYKVTDSGRVVLIEIAARNPGDGILELYHLSTGKLLEEAILFIALGSRPDYPQPTRIARQSYLPNSLGQFECIVVDSHLGVEVVALNKSTALSCLSPNAENAPAAIRQVQVLKSPGDSLAPVTSSNDRAASILMDASTEAEIDEIEREALRGVRVITKEP